MAFNLLNTVSGLFSNDLISRAASSLGESEGGIQKAISGVVPSVLAGLLTKASTGSTGAGSVLDMARQAAGSGILGNLSGLLGGSGGGTMSTLQDGEWIVRRQAGQYHDMISTLPASNLHQPFTG
jgi:hypothetical protein